MRLIEITKWSEFHKKLQNIKGNEYIYVKILCQERKGKIEAVDLQRFKGTLEINFPNSNFAYFLNVCYPAGCSVREFFYNDDKTCIIMNYRGVLKFNYQELPKKIIAIFNEQQLLNEMDKMEQNCSLVLANDLFLKKCVLKTSEKIDAAGFKVYLSKNDCFLSNAFFNAQFVFYDHFLEIKKPEDWYILEKFSDGDLVVSVKNDLQNFAMRPINLANFSGNMYILGNGFSMNNVKVFFSNNSCGFIGELHPYANLYIENLGFKNFTFEGNKPVYCGTVLGSRVKHGYQSPEGKVFIRNCLIRNILLPESYLHTDVLVGDDSLDYDLEDVHSYQVFANRRAIFPGRVKAFSLKRIKVDK